MINRYRNWNDWYKSQKPTHFTWTKELEQLVWKLEKKHDVHLTDVMDKLNANYFTLPTKRVYFINNKKAHEKIIYKYNLNLLQEYINNLLINYNEKRN